MYYQPYFNLSLLHSYYQKEVCPDFTVEPTQFCQHILKGHRLVFKPSINGFQILIPMESEQQPAIALDKSLIFTFLLKLQNPDFITFTHLASSYHPGRSIYAFSNETTKNSKQLELKPIIIERQKLAQPKSEQTPLESRCAAIAELQTSSHSQILGIVEIYNNASLTQNEKQSIKFTIKFTPKEQTWNYYLITDRTTAIDSFSIKEKDAKSKAFSFSQVTSIEGDRIIASIQQRFPESQTILLRSDTSVICSENNRPQLQLFKKEANNKSNNGSATQPSNPSNHEQNKLWIPSLPIPSHRHGNQVINLLTEV